LAIASGHTLRERQILLRKIQSHPRYIQTLSENILPSRFLQAIPENEKEKEKTDKEQPSLPNGTNSVHEEPIPTKEEQKEVRIPYILRNFGLTRRKKTLVALKPFPLSI